MSFDAGSRLSLGNNPIKAVAALKLRLQAAAVKAYTNKQLISIADLKQIIAEKIQIANGLLSSPHNALALESDQTNHRAYLD